MRKVVLFWVLACAGATGPTLAQEAPPKPTWPERGSFLRPAHVTFPKGFRTRRIFIDAGHGGSGNAGASSVLCEHEADFTLRVAARLAAYLRKSGHFVVKESRRPGELVSNRERIDAADRFRADALVSIHFDVRGEATAWEPPGLGMPCMRNDTAPGFAVLFSDEGTDDAVAPRRELARALTRELTRAGFLAFLGEDHLGLYAADAEVGAWVDRHASNQRVMLLRRPKVPSVIIETHHSLDFQEAARWHETRTLDVFESAVEAALVERFHPSR